MSYDFVVTSEDTIVLIFNDDDGDGNLTPIDLTAATSVKMVAKFNSDTAGEYTLTKDPDQVTNPGKTSYVWQFSDLKAGLLQVQGKFTDGAGNVRRSTEILEFQVLPVLA
jgi:hypothetical protein